MSDYGMSPVVNRGRLQAIPNLYFTFFLDDSEDFDRAGMNLIYF